MNQQEPFFLYAYTYDLEERKRIHIQAPYDIVENTRFKPTFIVAKTSVSSYPLKDITLDQYEKAKQEVLKRNEGILNIRPIQDENYAKRTRISPLTP